MPARQRTGQQLSRNSHWSLVWSNIGRKGWGAKFHHWKKGSKISTEGNRKSRYFTNLTQAHITRSERGCQSNWTHQHLLLLPAGYHHRHISAISNNYALHLLQCQICQFKLLSAVTSPSPSDLALMHISTFTYYFPPAQQYITSSLLTTFKDGKWLSSTNTVLAKLRQIVQFQQQCQSGN